MTWEWSHTQEAYTNAERNMRRLSDEVLVVIFAEWRASDRDEHWNYDLDLSRYKRELSRGWSWLRRGRREEMENFIWEQASELRSCTNGGWEAWMCPHGCGCHMVTFDSEEEAA